MIHINRTPEPSTLSGARNFEMQRLRALGRTPSSDDIVGYRIVVRDLWRMQEYKCCYCERKLTQCFNDVEHYRPKSRADRRPGCTDTHGYWWLAFTWENLLFACAPCNRSEKNDQFPLSLGCSPLQAEMAAPGLEVPLVIDPCGLMNPMEHIVFVREQFNGAIAEARWWARPRNGSEFGLWTIRVCGINDGDLPELRGDHVERCLVPRIEKLEGAIRAGRRARILGEFEECLMLLRRGLPYVALTYDVLRHHFPASVLAPWRLDWPVP
jgi:uncharacterized protein (TIGR02646 family)